MLPRLLIFTLLLASAAGASATGVENCATSAEEAALKFVELGVTDPRGATALLRDRDLRQLRLRLEQLADSRYSPDSATFRVKAFGPEWSSDRFARESDAGVVGQYLSSGQEARKDWMLSDLRVARSRMDPIQGQLVEVRYEITTSRGKSEQRREFRAYPTGSCWKLDVPVEAWVRVEHVARVLKEGRTQQPQADRAGRPTLRLQVAEASSASFSGARELPLRGEMQRVWMASKPLATEANVLSARAAWDCEQGFGPEAAALWLQFDADGARRIAQWSGGNLGKMLAVAIDDQVVVFARVAGALKDRLSVCLPGSRLEDAELLGARLMGSTR
jgi:hypothetical protein